MVKWSIWASLWCGARVHDCLWECECFMEVPCLHVDYSLREGTSLLWGNLVALLEHSLILVEVYEHVRGLLNNASFFKNKTHSNLTHPTLLKSQKRKTNIPILLVKFSQWDKATGYLSVHSSWKMDLHQCKHKQIYPFLYSWICISVELMKNDIWRSNATD